MEALLHQACTQERKRKKRRREEGEAVEKKKREENTKVGKISFTYAWMHTYARERGKEDNGKKRGIRMEKT